MKIELYKPELYPLLEVWWAAKKFGSVPAILLPKEGWVAYIDEKPIATAFLYTTNTPIAWVEWLVSNPESTKAERDETIPALLSFIEKEAVARGAMALFTSTQPEGVIKRFEACGFVVADTGMTNLIKGIK